jgi:hypothetical protein
MCCYQSPSQGRDIPAVPHHGHCEAPPVRAIQVVLPTAEVGIVHDGIHGKLTGMAAPDFRETGLYGPVKRLLERQGYTVKSEIETADIVAVRGAEAPVIVELKAGFSLTLFHQAVERQAITDAVYVAVPRKTGHAFAKSMRSNTSLCRRLGLGLMTVRLKDGLVEIHNDPAPYKPLRSTQRKERLLKAFAKLVGDPNTGGSTREGLMTAYRQDALRCVKVLHENGPTKAAEISRLSTVVTARRLMADNHYGWFERVRTGIYALSPKGQSAAVDYAREIAEWAMEREQRANALSAVDRRKG